MDVGDDGMITTITIVAVAVAVTVALCVNCPLYYNQVNQVPRGSIYKRSFHTGAERSRCTDRSGVHVNTPTVLSFRYRVLEM